MHGGERGVSDLAPSATCPVGLARVRQGAYKTVAHPALLLVAALWWAALGGRDCNRCCLCQREHSHAAAAAAKSCTRGAGQAGEDAATGECGRIVGHAARWGQGCLAKFWLPERQAPILHPLEEAEQAVLRPACEERGEGCECRQKHSRAEMAACSAQKHASGSIPGGKRQTKRSEQLACSAARPIPKCSTPPGAAPDEQAGPALALDVPVQGGSHGGLRGLALAGE